MKKKWKIVLGSLLILGLVGFFIAENIKGLDANKIEVKIGSIASTFKEDGMVRAETEQPIHAFYSGEIKQLAVKEGQQVKKGDLLSVINTTELDYQIQQLQGQLKSLAGEQAGIYQEPNEAEIAQQQLLIQQAERDIHNIELNYQRTKKLYEEGVATKRDYEEVENYLEQARINLALQQERLALIYQSYSPRAGVEEALVGQKEAINSQIELLRYQKNKATSVAPVAGIIANVNVKQGEIAPLGVPLMSIFSSQGYLVETYILTSDVPSVEIGMKVDLIQDRRGDEVIFDGVVTKIAPTAVDKISALGLQEQRVKVTIQPNVPEEISIFPGYRLDVEFTTDRREDVLTVPKTVLFPYENGQAVWVVREDRASVQPVETGFENDRDVVITSGLTAGDVVITNPRLTGLSEGTKIN